MAIVKVPDESRTITQPAEVKTFLTQHGIQFEPWGVERLGDSTAKLGSEEILKAYRPEIDRLKSDNGYVTADIINVTSATPNLDALLAKFDKEHRHADDEVRFTILGSGVFTIHDEKNKVVFEIQVSPGDLINVPAYTAHWFDLCKERTIQCIRLFKDPAGWSPIYTGTKVEEKYEPVCLGPASLNPTLTRRAP
ncbi:MAG: cupin domain-containing protein [Candidatus Omnitrophica bacterium]|nr:cupin domain-containing protein [Candidatus Omnitrophota bacterium]